MSESQTDTPSGMAASREVSGLPLDKRERFCEVATKIKQFGAAHLDPDLTGFALELWKRVCRTKRLDCRRGNSNVWAAAVALVIARMNFLFDQSQPVHLSFDTICDFFGVKKTTVGNKATEIERTLRLRRHSEPDLCRSGIVDACTIVQLSNGFVVPLKMAKEMGLVPQDATLR